MPTEYTSNQALEKRWPVLVTTDTPSLSKVAMDRPVCVVGARSNVHLPLPSLLVSKAHALLIHGPGGVWLRDLGSKNNTFLNNKAVRETRLMNGDFVRFGPFTFRCARGFDTMVKPDPLPAGELHLETGRSTPPRILSLARQTCLIGSRFSCDVLLPGDTISKAHAVIFVRAGRRYLRDLTSISGTLLNGAPVRENELRHGDEIRIANARMVYHMPDGQIVPGLSDSDDTKVGIPAIFRDVKELTSPKPPAKKPAKARPTPMPSGMISWDHPKPVRIDIEEATRQESGK